MMDDWNERFHDLAQRARDGDQQAIEELWRYYYPRLRSAVRHRVQSIPVLLSDSSDLTSEALHGFFHRAFIDQEFDLRSPNAVWKLLRLFTTRHVNDHFKRLAAQKRGGPKTRLRGTNNHHADHAATKLNHHHLDHHRSSYITTNSNGLAEVSDSKQPTPEADMESVELLDRLLATIRDERARQVILLRLENRSNAEIAELLGISLRTVQRLIKQMILNWENLLKERP